MQRPLVLVILDGWGLSPEVEGNAILSAETPFFDSLISQFPYASLHASGEEVGLPWGEMGNSEVGHLNLGTGRIIQQDLPRINKAIEEGTFLNNEALLEAIDYAERKNSNLHILGLFSSGGVHSHMRHLLALLDLAALRKFSRVYLHLVSDGRDTPPRIILQDLPKLQAKITQLNFGTIASVMGRFWAMDRDKRVERTEKAYQTLTGNQGLQAASAEDAINNSYKINKSDEFIEPTAITGTPRISDNDSVIFFNFRADRAKQISEKLIKNKKIFFTTFASYGIEPTPTTRVAFISPKLTNQLAMIFAQNKISQLHMAETEKYPHVTYFFNGGWEALFDHEKRIMVSSPKVATYDQAPEMSADKIATQFTNYFNINQPQFTVINFANPDMVGHTGNLDATVAAVSAADRALGKIATNLLTTGKADLIVTADHGNAEQMINPQTGDIDKEHTTNPVPLILAFNGAKRGQPPVTLETKIALAAQQPLGVLADIAATIVSRLGFVQPEELTGQDLFKNL